MTGKQFITLFVFCAALMTFALPAGAEVRLVDTGRVLSAHGFKDGRFDPGADPIAIIDVKSHQNFGSIEKTASFLDTAEEFITAAYYSPIQVPASARAAIDRELPRGKEGALRLGSMWLRKTAEHPENKAGYRKALDLIASKSSVTMNEINTYYAGAIEKEILAKGRSRLGRFYSYNELKNTVLRPVVEYYINPTEENLRRMAVAANSSKNIYDYILFVGDLNSDLGAKVNALTNKL